MQKKKSRAKSATYGEEKGVAVIQPYKRRRAAPKARPVEKGNLRGDKGGRERKRQIKMKWLKIDYIKKHSRIDFDCEDDLLELYGNAAEETVLNICRRTQEDLIEEYGDVPDALRVASLMLVEVSYTNRAPVSAQSMSIVPYAFDMMVKPYVRLAD